jgi:biopolymer transport protein TolR
MADINVTSLVDVAFTLLVIFIITAPILQGGIELELPEGASAPLTADQEPIVVSVDSDGNVYVDDQPVEDIETMAELVGRMVERAGGAMVFVRGDRAVDYGRIVGVLSAVNELEGASISVVTETPPRSP